MIQGYLDHTRFRLLCIASQDTVRPPTAMSILYHCAYARPRPCPFCTIVRTPAHGHVRFVPLCVRPPTAMSVLYRCAYARPRPCPFCTVVPKHSKLPRHIATKHSNITEVAYDRTKDSTTNHKLFAAFRKQGIVDYNQCSPD